MQSNQPCSRWLAMGIADHQKLTQFYHLFFSSQRKLAPFPQAGSVSVSRSPHPIRSSLFFLLPFASSSITLIRIRLSRFQREEKIIKMIKRDINGTIKSNKILNLFSPTFFPLSISFFPTLTVFFPLLETLLY